MSSTLILDTFVFAPPKADKAREMNEKVQRLLTAAYKEYHAALDALTCAKSRPGNVKCNAWSDMIVNGLVMWFGSLVIVVLVIVFAAAPGWIFVPLTGLTLLLVTWGSHNAWDAAYLLALNRALAAAHIDVANAPMDVKNRILRVLDQPGTAALIDAFAETLWVYVDPKTKQSPPGMLSAPVDRWETLPGLDVINRARQAALQMPGFYAVPEDERERILALRVLKQVLYPGLV